MLRPDVACRGKCVSLWYYRPGAPDTPAVGKEIERTTHGRFAPGTSGNPGGRPKTVKDVVMLARQHTTVAIQTLVDVAQNGRSEIARVRAAEVLLDRAHGGVVSQIDLRALVDEDGDGQPWTFDLSGARDVVPLRPAPDETIEGELVSEDDAAA
ncbi:MAG: hypothetical protein KGL39_48325 [Patescibacteria group bacterium]|nr:hypothetical protein [Patescibacteria group bacterium]